MIHKKKILLAGMIGLLAGLPVEAALYSYSGSAYAIADGNPNGAFSSISVSGAAATITHVNVNLNLSGGYNGDLYGYLTYNGTLVTLLNRTGTGGGDSFGYGDSGFNITLNDSAANGSIHNYQNISNPNGGVLTGTWAPDGGTLASFNGGNPNGTWTLFFADLSGGGGQSIVNGWSLDITAVPEPATQALMIVGTIWGSWSLLRWLRSRRASAGKAW